MSPFVAFLAGIVTGAALLLGIGSAIACWVVDRLGSTSDRETRQ